jgi:hypothetical protein
MERFLCFFDDGPLSLPWLEKCLAVCMYAVRMLKKDQMNRKNMKLISPAPKTIQVTTSTVDRSVRF